MNDTDTKDRTLRHGLTCLWPSEIAEQFYCEYKVHLKRLHPEVQFELPPLELGQVGHMVLESQAEPITPAEIARTIGAGKKLAMCEWVLVANFRDVQLRGRPDFFAFEGQKAHLLLEFKFTSARTPFRDQQVQAQTYALLAEGMGFSLAELCLGIVMFPPTGLDGGLRDAALTKGAMLQFLNERGTLQDIYERCEQARKALLAGRTMRKTIESDGWKVFLFRIDADRATRDLAWALDYWLARREPVPEKRYPRKCFACPLNAVGLCEHALEKPDPAFCVVSSPDGRILVSR